MARKIITAIIINLMIFSGLPWVLAQENNSASTCLSPQLQLQNLNMSSACQAIYQSIDITLDYKIPAKENPEYIAFLEKLTKHVGTADDIMNHIKDKYSDKYGRAIEKLEAKEAQRPEEYSWVVKHEEEVMLIAYCMAKVLGFREGQLARIAIGCRFHDIGKCDIDPGIISDERVFADRDLFTSEQREIIRNEIAEHSAKSHDILKESGITDEIILAVPFYHHANIDGTGYPDPVTRQAIPLEAKIARVADSFSAMLGTRPYNKRLKHSFASAVEDISDNSYVLYGPRVVQSFLSLIAQDDVSSRHEELYYIPLKESRIFHALYKQAEMIPYQYPFAKVACGISSSWNQEPFCSATNTIGTHRHAEINLVLKVIDQQLRLKNLKAEYLPLLRRAEFLAYTRKINQSEEAMGLLKELSAAAGNPFNNAVIYVTLRPCGACLSVFKHLGVKEVYYGSEHPDTEFVHTSADAVIGAGRDEMKIKRSYFANEGVIEPNSLFFALCLKPGCEKLSSTINEWFATRINHNDQAKMSIVIMRQKQKIFQHMVSTFLSGVNKDSDLEKINVLLLEARSQLEPSADFQDVFVRNMASNAANLKAAVFIEQAI